MEMRIRPDKIIDSPLLMVQKIDVIKIFLLPMLDFMLLNADASVKQLRDIDQNIRETIDRVLKVRGLPVKCHQASWRDGGFSYPSLLDRREVWLVRSLTQMMLSKDEKVREAMQWFVEGERRYRGLPEAPGSNFIKGATSAAEEVQDAWRQGRGKRVRSSRYS
jgi:hypothetical protein